MTKRKAISFLLVVFVLAALVSPAPLKAATTTGSAPTAQSISASTLSYLELWLLYCDPALLAVIAPFLPPAGIVER